MDEFGKSALIAIAGLMASAALVATGVVLQPPPVAPPALPPGPQAPAVSLAIPSPVPAPTRPQAPTLTARLSPPPGEPGLAPPAATPLLPRYLTPPPSPGDKPLQPGPYAPTPALTIPGPVDAPDRPPKPPATPPKVLALEAAPPAAPLPSLHGATPPPRPTDKPLPPPVDYAPGPYVPALTLTLPAPPTATDLPGAVAAAARPTTLAALPTLGPARLPVLQSARRPPSPSGKPPPPLSSFPRGPYAPALTLSLPTPPDGIDQAPPAPGRPARTAPQPAPRVARATLPTLKGAARPPKPIDKPPPPTSSYTPGPYAPALIVTIPTPPLGLGRPAAPPGAEANVVRSLVPPPVEAEMPALDGAQPPPTPSAKPGPERQVATIQPLPLEAAPSRPALAPATPGVPPASNGHWLDSVDGKLPPWRRYAALAPPDDGRPMVAVIIDDLGMNRHRADRVVALRPPLTLAILPYAKHIEAWAKQARAAGHELMLHLPMEPTDSHEDPGPNALLDDLDMAEIERRIDWNLARFHGYVGVNNHMGSRFTANAALMRPLMKQLRQRGLLFVDSLTTSASVGGELAQSLGIPTVSRDIFLDNDIDLASIQAQLAKLEHCARRKGYCVAIGHPHPETIRALELWLPTLDSRGFQLVPISAVVARRMTG